MTKRTVALIGILTLGILFPFFAFAAPATELKYTLLAPVGDIPTQPTLSQYLQGMFRFLIGLSGALAVIMIVICGIKYMGSGDNSGGKSDAKECIKNAIFGVLIALGAWILLNTINPLTLSNNFIVPKLPTASGGGSVPDPKPGTQGKPAIYEPLPTNPGFWYRWRDETGIHNERYESAAECTAMTEEHYKKNGILPVEGIDCKQITPTNRPITQSEKDTRTSLCGNESCVCGTKTCPGKAVSINKSPCLAGQTACTNVGGLPNDTVDFIKSLAQACNCQILITGGTEPGHKTHAPNSPIFDLRLTPLDPLYRLIKGADADISEQTGKKGFCSFAGNRAWLYNEYYFTDEKSAVNNGGVRHWHVCKKGAQKCAFVNENTKNATSCK